MNAASSSVKFLLLHFPIIRAETDQTCFKSYGKRPPNKASAPPSTTPEKRKRIRSALIQTNKQGSKQASKQANKPSNIQTMNPKSKKKKKKKNLSVCLPLFHRLLSRHGGTLDSNQILSPPPPSLSASFFFTHSLPISSYDPLSFASEFPPPE